MSVRRHITGTHNAGGYNAALDDAHHSVTAVFGIHQDSDPHALHAPVLVLNASYEPINICAARRAIVLVLKGVAMTEEENGHFLHAARLALRVPSVIRLLEYRRIPHQTRALSRKNILLRDRNTCQYCGELLASGDLTLDHVIPRSRGGASTWENLVAACHGCNRRKGNQMPLEAGMKLMREPHAFNLHTSRHIMRLMGRWMTSGGSIFSIETGMLRHVIPMKSVLITRDIEQAVFRARFESLWASDFQGRI